MCKSKVPIYTELKKSFADAQGGRVPSHIYGSDIAPVERIPSGGTWVYGLVYLSLVRGISVVSGILDFSVERTLS